MTYQNFLLACKTLALPEPIREVLFAKEYKRKWQSDFIFERNGIKIAVEIEGGAWVGGRHTRGAGFINDMQKYNCYTMLGYRLLRFTAEQAEKTPIWCARFIAAVFDGQVNSELKKPVQIARGFYFTAALVV
jgi:hypothetical protein